MVIKNDTIIFGECGSGFFSTCSLILTYTFEFFNKNKKLPILIDSSKMFGVYKNHVNQDIYKICFYEKDIDIKYEDDIFFSKTKMEGQFSDYKLLNFEKVLPFVRKYFNPTNFITEKIDYLESKYNINYNNNYCGVFYRGNDKIKETQKPPYEEVLIKALELKNKNPDVIFIVQTDEEEFLHFFLNNFSNSIYFKEIPVIQNSMTTVARAIENNLDKLDILGYFIASIFIQSKLKNIICSSGNCELFIVFFRENANGVFQYLKKNEFIHGTKNIEFNPNETQNWF
jgi:hypothetical protein